MKPSVPFEQYLIAKLEDPDYARVYLETALEAYGEDRDSDAFLLALRDAGHCRCTRRVGQIGAGDKPQSRGDFSST